ncbi:MULTISPECIES: P2 family phage major capsid protein [unclassified Photorhabdus]|uniref:P2 family phage major capsid protein n=1 Tax=unclassified Photorhabdus TaxID=2620880 RepID=UPI000DCE8D1F|nr:MULTISPECIES: P2 family phage major capsid protein [unclassified Photorhabdus]RAW93273.1 hypothetical protein CKY03_22185 [Photorhabdus sp. S9-53]RAW93821.1 hypothetical protein CKY05_21825 [Photorhabdus sp. S10-54]RAW96936.1 hypothetical protein CKY04_22140 [Photorhabdus sp. S8-52]
MQLNHRARSFLQKYTAGLAQAYGVEDTSRYFALTDPKETALRSALLELDAMASDLINACIPQQFRHDPRLVVLVGADLVAAEQYRLYQAADKPTEKIAAQMLGSSIAGCLAMIPPFMPGKRMSVTLLSNLQILTQRNTRQRKAAFEDDRKQFENKYLRNEGYALEEPELYAAYDEDAVIIGTVAEPAEKLDTE